MLKPYLNGEIRRHPDPEINLFFIVIWIGVSKEKCQAYSFWFSGDRFVMGCPGVLTWEE